MRIPPSRLRTTAPLQEIRSLPNPSGETGCDMHVGTDLTITILDRQRIPESISNEIDRLAAESIEPNVFFEWWTLSPAIDNLVRDEPIIVLIRDGLGQLAGLFPFVIKKRFCGLPIRTLRLVNHRHGLLFTPLVSANFAKEAVDLLLRWVESGRSPSATLEMLNVSADGPFMRLLTEALASRPGWETHQEIHERAFFKPHDSSEPGLSAKHRKELRRLERRLAEQGELTYRVYDPSEASQPWIDQFLALEARGWKGRNDGFAMGRDDSDRKFFQSVMRAGAQRRRIQMLALELNGAPIAMKLNFLLGDGSYAFKIAYNEDHAKYSPGVLLELFYMRHIADNCPEINWIDSGARPDHPMINRIWTSRRPISHYLAAYGNTPGRMMVKSWDSHKALRATLKRVLGKE